MDHLLASALERHAAIQGKCIDFYLEHSEIIDQYKQLQENLNTAQEEVKAALRETPIEDGTSVMHGFKVSCTTKQVVDAAALLRCNDTYKNLHGLFVTTVTVDEHALKAYLDAGAITQQDVDAATERTKQVRITAPK